MTYLARHGETDWNRQGRMQGRQGAALNELGRAQAERLARVAAVLGVRRVVSSPLARAVETARTVAAHLRIEHETLEALMELDFGACTSLTEPEIQLQFPGLHAARNADKWHHRWPNGESYADAAVRLARTLEDGSLPLGEDVLLVAHQSVNRALTHLLSRLPPAEVLRMAQRSDVLLRFGSQGALSHASFGDEAGAELTWVEGPYLAGTPRLN
jgi:broad specificity phosphatase PhoE